MADALSFASPDAQAAPPISNTLFGIHAHTHTVSISPPFGQSMQLLVFSLVMHTLSYSLTADRAAMKKAYKSAINLSSGLRSRGAEVQPIPLMAMNSFACRRRCRIQVRGHVERRSEYRKDTTRLVWTMRPASGREGSRAQRIKRSDVGQVPVLLSAIHPVANHEYIRDLETPVIKMDSNGPS